MKTESEVKIEALKAARKYYPCNACHFKDTNENCICEGVGEFTHGYWLGYQNAFFEMGKITIIKEY